MRFLAFILAVSVCRASASESQTAANPIRKVVSMLQLMQKKVVAEGEKEEALYKKFQCYCKTGGGDLKKSIAAGDNSVPELESSIKEAEAKKAQLTSDLASHQADRSNAKSAIQKSTGIREKEAATFAAFKAESEKNIAAMDGAVKAIESGMSGFLQTDSASALKQIILSRQSMADVDRDDVLAFLSGSANQAYAPASGQIVGILKQMGDEMKADLAAATGDEGGAISSHASLVDAKNKEIGALTDSIESKTKRSGEVAVNIVQMKNSLSDTQKALLDDKKFLAELEKNCASKAAEWEVIVQTRAQELVALADTIKILNDDDALELFKKALPNKAASFVQILEGNKERRSRALALLDAGHGKKPNVGLDFITLALKGKTVGGFDKVIKMIDEMAAILKKEQEDDDNKKEYCETEFDNTDDKKKSLEHAISDHEANIASAEEGITKTTEEIAALEAGIKALDKSVAEASDQRKAENAEFKDLMSSNSAAKELMKFAKNRLAKFYDPKLYKPPPAREMTEEERITHNLGGDIGPEAPKGGIAGTGISGFVDIREHNSVAPPPPPEAPGAYKKKGEENNGVMAMLDLLIGDLDKQMTEAKTNEENSQSEYEKLMADSADKRATDSKTLTDKQSTKANLQASKQDSESDLKAANDELMALSQYIASLHAECDWLVKYFDARKAARAAEVDSLSNAKAVLSGADYSFVQSSSSLRGAKRH